VIDIRGAGREARQRLLRNVRPVTERIAPRLSRFLVDRLGVMSLPGYRSVGRLVLRRWIQVVDAHLDVDYYLGHVGPAGRRHAARDPALHYCLTGWMQGFSPNAGFDPHAYRGATEKLHWAADPFLHSVEHATIRPRLESAKPVLSAPMFRPVESSLGAVPSGRCVIYTAVTGGYDALRPPEAFPQDCDFVVFSDQALQVEGWKTLPLSYGHPDPRRAARHAKLHPHILFPDHEYSIWIDANIGVRGDIGSLCASLGPQSPVAAFVHPLQDCIFAEGRAAGTRPSAEAGAIARQLERYGAAGWPRHGGFWQTSVLVRRHHDATCVAMMADWWDEIEVGSAFDQISFPVVAGRHSVSISPLGVAGLHARNHPFLTSAPHLPIRIKPDPSFAPSPVTPKHVDVDTVAATVAVISNGADDSARRCMAALLPGLTGNMRAILALGTDSEAETARLPAPLASFRDRLSVVRQGGGYSDILSAILNVTQGDWILLIDAQAAVRPGILRKLIVAAGQLPRLGVVGTLGNGIQWPARGGQGRTSRADELDEFCEHQWNGRVLLVPALTGGCVALRRSLLAEFGKGHAKRPIEQNAFLLDACLRAARHGLACGVAADCYVEAGGKSDPGLAASAAALRAGHSPDRIEAVLATLRDHPVLGEMRGHLARMHSTDKST
jgi:hypothetical protein